MENENILAMNVIEPLQTECAAPVAFTPRKDGSLPICVDYCKVNSVTVPNSYPI